MAEAGAARLVPPGCNVLSGAKRSNVPSHSFLCFVMEEVGESGGYEIFSPPAYLRGRSYSVEPAKHTLT